MTVDTATRRCSFCEADAPSIARQTILRRLEVQYFQCPRCDLLFTEKPYWLDESYSHALTELDTGAVQRNAISARLCTLLAVVLALPPEVQALDYGGGHGVFVRMMRDVGLDFRWYDKHGENLYARGFEGDPARHHDLITAFEVLEHFDEVGDELARLFAPRPDYVLVGTLLHRGHQPGWWYYLLDSGQHVSFYSERTMAAIGERFGYEVFAGHEHTLFARRGIDLGRARRAIVRRLVSRPALALAMASLVPPPLLQRLTPYRSLLLSDHDELRRRLHT